jgi:hypothetical protein
MLQCFEMVRNVPLIILDCLNYLCVPTYKNIFILGLHVAVFKYSKECPPNHPRVSHLPLCTHSQGYFIT